MAGRTAIELSPRLALAIRLAVATYEKQIVVPASMLQDGLAVRLDFGEGKPEQPQVRRAIPTAGYGQSAARAGRVAGPDPLDRNRP